MNKLYSPLFLTEGTSPTDKRKIHRWGVFYFQIQNPILDNAINLHANYPITTLNEVPQFNLFRQKSHAFRRRDECRVDF